MRGAYFPRWVTVNFKLTKSRFRADIGSRKFSIMYSGLKNQRLNLTWQAESTRNKRVPLRAVHAEYGP